VFIDLSRHASPEALFAEQSWMLLPKRKLHWLEMSGFQDNKQLRQKEGSFA